MKISDVPQDGQYLEQGTVRDVCYAIDENGVYQPVISVGWEAKNDALSLAWEQISEEAEATLKEVQAGKKSPLAYHMEVCLLNVKLLAAHTGISKKEVKKHLMPEAFCKLDEATLAKYADALRISVEELKKV